MSRLLLLAGASPHYVGGLMQNAPLLALFAHQGFEEMVALLMDFGADVNGRNADGITPLMFACQRGRSEVSRTLVQHGAVVNAIDNDDKSALLYAAEYGHLEIVELLVACDWGHLTNELGLMEAAQQATVTAASKGHIQVSKLYQKGCVNFSKSLRYFRFWSTSWTCTKSILMPAIHYTENRH